MSGGVEFHLCGDLRVSVDGEAREGAVRGRQGRLVLAHLVLHRNRPVRRDELLEALTPPAGPPPGPTVLPPVLSRLRQALAPAGIDGRDALTLRLPEVVWVDVEAVHAGLAEARRLLDTDAQAALTAARDAATLAAPGLLPGLEADWLDEPRAALADARVEALELAARAGIAYGPAALAGAESNIRTAIAAAPFRESARAVLIEVLRARGNVAEAVRAFEDIRTLLREELGTVPGRELMALHAQLIAGEGGPRPPGGVRAPAGLVERDLELEQVEAALARLAGGIGGLVLFEGPAGIGKTRLLAELRTRAQQAEARVLEARAGVLEREYGFGVVRQLLEAVAAEPGALDGPAAPARAVVGQVAGAAEGSFAILDGLFHLVLATAKRGPLVLLVDDLQWSDPGSLRFVTYLARRLATLPVLVAATVRTGEPGSDEALLDELAGGPSAVVLRPAPLTEGATGSLVRAKLGEDAEATFVEACQQVTAGNPLLVGQLLSALAAERVQPSADQAERVRGVGPRAVSRTVLVRLGRLGETSVAVARAVAVLGEGPDVAAVAALAATSEAEAVEAIGALVRAEILRAEGPLGFVHPLVRDAIYGEVPAATRGLEHARAARALAELAASPESVAAQLLLAPPRGDPWVVEQLRGAAAVALARGAPDASLALLERAQAEPPPAAELAALALELGGSAAYVRGPDGVEPLRRAYEGLTDPIERGRAAVRLSHLLMFVSSPREGVELARAAAAELPATEEDTRLGLLANRFVGIAFGAGDVIDSEEIAAVRRGPRGTGPGAKALTAMTALSVALACEPAEEASALAREVLDTQSLRTAEVSAPVALGCVALALGDPAEGQQATVRYAEDATRRGEILGSIGSDLWGGFAHMLCGDLPAAIASLEQAHEGELLWGTKLDAVMGYSAAFLALAWLERGDRERAWAALLRTAAVEGTSDGARFWLASHAELLIADGRYDEAIAITDRLAPMRPPVMHPIWAPWRGLRARALAGLRRVDEAVALAEEELDLAQQIGAPWLIGRGLRILSEVSGDPAPARGAVEHLAASSARLELAKARAAALTSSR